MKKLFLSYLFFSLTVISASAQSPPWLWAKAAGGTDYDRGYGITTDANGNVIIFTNQK